MHKVEKKDILISASVSCMDLSNLKEHMAIAEQTGVDFYHFDVVDGEFNNCFILGQTLFETMRGCTQLPIEVHLAVYHPEKYIEQFIKLGADYVGVHYEVMDDPQTIFNQIRGYGAMPVLSYKAETKFCSEHIELLKDVAWINKLTVNPGYSGQKIQMPAIEHIRDMRKAIDQAGMDVGIQADGNINKNTIPMVIKAGANILTGGTSGLFKKENSVAENIEDMRSAALSASEKITIAL